MKFTKALVRVEEMYAYQGDYANKNVVETAEGLQSGLHYTEAQALVAAGIALPKYALNPLGGIMPQGQNIVLPSQLKKALGLPTLFIDGKVNPAFTEALERVRHEVFLAIKQLEDRADKNSGEFYPNFQYMQISTTGVFAQQAQIMAGLEGKLVEPTLLDNSTPVVEETEEASELDSKVADNA